MGSTATDIDSQIKILEERGLIIHDYAKTKELLLDVGYYRLGFYFYYFQDTEHNFEEDIFIDDIV